MSVKLSVSSSVSIGWFCRYYSNDRYFTVREFLGRSSDYRIILVLVQKLQTLFFDDLPALVADSLTVEGAMFIFLINRPHNDMQ